MSVVPDRGRNYLNAEQFLWLSFVGANRTTHRENRFEHETENDSTIARPSMLHRLSRRQCGCEDRGKQRPGQMGERVGQMGFQTRCTKALLGDEWTDGISEPSFVTRSPPSRSSLQ